MDEANGAWDEMADWNKAVFQSFSPLVWFFYIGSADDPSKSN